MKRFRSLLAVLPALLLTAPAVRAQLELKAGTFNPLFVSQTASGTPATAFGPPNVSTPPPTAGQFAAFGAVSGSVGPLSNASSFSDRYPANVAKTLVLSRASIGGAFASGLPRYTMGDIITPPLTDVGRINPAPENYWRAQPVFPGEIIQTGGSSQTLIPLGTVTVATSSTNSTAVSVLSVPSQLVLGTTLLGQPVTGIVGTSITLGGNANATITSPTPATLTPALSYYYSPHAEKVFASQPGGVEVKWVTRLPVSGGDYGVLTEIFAVSSTSRTPARTIYWTEGSFDGPLVHVTDARITSINPVFYSAVPKAVPEEVNIPGYNPITPNLTTLSFSKYNGSGQIHAYNTEGRIFVEYLGNVRLADDIYEHLGFDIVDIKRVPSANYVSVNLGKEILPHDGDTTLTPSPVLAISQNAASYYGTSVRLDNTSAYSAERTTSPEKNPDDGAPASPDAYNKVVFYWLETGTFNIKWPKFQDRYWLRWSATLTDYAHYTVDPTGSTPDTGIAFDTGLVPQLIFQDDPAQTEASIDLQLQRFHVQFNNGNLRNRSLLRFTSSSETWYANIYTQSENRQITLAATSSADIVTVPTTVGLEVGMVVTGSGLTGYTTISRILDATRYEIVQSVPDLTGPLTHTVQSDNAAPINTTATVGTRLTPPSGHEFSGYISSGTAYYPGGYLNPFTTGVAAADKGAIIPVNAQPGNDTLTVRWFRKVAAPSAAFSDFYVPGKVGRYTISYPASTSPSIVIAKGVGTDDLPAAEALGSIYYQNDSALPGYNPNEEHAFLLAGRAWALRDDLNVTSGSGYTSAPFLLLAYTDPTDQRPAIRAYQIQRTDATHDFNYISTAGTLLTKPSPLPLLPLAFTGTGSNARAKDIEVLGSDNPSNTTLASQSAYSGFTFQDRKGFTWVHRGPHRQKRLISATYGSTSSVVDVTATISSAISDQTNLVVNSSLAPDPAPNAAKFLTVTYRTEDGTSVETFDEDTTYTPPADPRLSMKLYYVSQDGFFIPGATTQPAPGTILPFLRNPARSGLPLNLAAIDNGQLDEPLQIIYRPEWPTQAPELRVAETLTLPKFGLPQIRGQSSAQVLYQNSLAKAPSGLTKTSVSLHDPTREKFVFLDNPNVNLAKIPASVATTDYNGKTYFQGLPPQLQQRFFLDPLRGQRGTLVFIGKFHDVPAGEDYLDLNVLSTVEEAALNDLVPASDPDKAKWTAAIQKLFTTVQTFKENPAVAGTWIVDPTKDVIVGKNDLALISDPNTAVDSYALTATGQGTGFVTMVFGNGRAFTSPGDPVEVEIFRVSPQLYTGDLKVVASSNPLDEQVTLRHSADFAGKPQNYEFEWRWTTGSASAPAVYTTAITTSIGSTNPVTNTWNIVSDPGALLPTAAQYAASPASIAVTLPRSVNVRPDSYSDAEQAAGLPSVVLKSVSGVDFTTGVPGDIFFSANMGALDGFVLYVNGSPALASNAPATFPLTNATTGLTTTGLSRQFSVASSWFRQGPNTIAVAVYTTADRNVSSLLDFHLEAALETDVVTPSNSAWSTPASGDRNTAIVGGSPLNPFGGPLFVLNDRWFTVRYRPTTASGNVLGSTDWSRWMPPQFVEGWVKRVLAAINPFEQRVKDLYNNSVNTDISVITQAGTRWEGDIALNLDNIGNTGLIAIYETVLNRAKSMSIDANTNDPDTNNALILAAGYLNDLYTLLGNEAFSDAANPTISIDDQNGDNQINTSRFSFEGQVRSSLDEELALLRGRDDLVSPGVITAPAYNRLYWNYTRGINSGEAIYALNYNIKEKVGSPTANGIVDEADAQRLFPQGHGDAYGHYLTALTNYYRLLTNPDFTWTPRAEAVTVLGQAVTVDYFDERKFAAAAGNIARSAEQILALTWRKTYTDDPASGWSHLRDSQPVNPQTGITRHQGMDEWASRSTQGALYHWAVANAMLPATDPVNTGIQKIDRTTVPELAQLPTLAASFQTTIDSANTYLNPLGLNPGAIAFDLSPTELENGVSHYEQVNIRALASLNNAAGAFHQAAVMTGALRKQENSLDGYNTTIVQQENAYRQQLISIFGKPYDGEVGPGKLYAQGYDGPDLFHWFIVDRPNDLVDTSAAVSVTIKEAKEFNAFTDNRIADIVDGLNKNTAVTEHTVYIQPSRFVQYNDVWKQGGLLSRPETGQLQDALQNAQKTQLAFSEFQTKFAKENAKLSQTILLFNELVNKHERHWTETAKTSHIKTGLNAVKTALGKAADKLEAVAAAAAKAAEAVAESLPTDVGVSTDATAPARGAALATGNIITNNAKFLAIAARAGATGSDIAIGAADGSLQKILLEMDFSYEERQLAYQFFNAYRDFTSHSAELMQLTINHQRAVQQVQNVLAKGNNLLSSRELFRQRAAATIQGYRTRDVTFRLFRNEALEQYRSLFELSSRYSYLAAKSYDYETGLLGSSQGQQVFSKIVASRSLGDLTGGVPQATTSTLGDAGLAGSMARLNADFSVAKGRLGINNPDQYGTVFSLRGELFRLLNDPSITADDAAWQQTLEQHIVTDLMADSDIAAQCRNLRKPDGSRVPGIVIPFSTTIQHGKNFFGLDLAAGDHAYTPANFATKIYNVGISLPGYVGMDAYATGDMGSGAPTSGAPTALSATPYVYLIPCGQDYMLAPALGDTNALRQWTVQDQALPLPYNLGASAFNDSEFFTANGTLSSQPWITRKHQPFRPVSDPSFFYSRVPKEFTNSRLIGRSAWNSQWKIVIPAYTLLSNEQDGLNRFVSSVKDVQLFLRTYSHSGN